MRKVAICFAGLGILLVTACSPSTANAGNVVSSPGIFSYQAPTGWTSQAVPGMEKNSFGSTDCVGPSQDGFPPKISVSVDSVFSVEKFTRTYARSLQPPGNMFRLVDQGDFKTSGGVAGIRFVVTDLENPPQREKITYAFPGANGATIKVTCTCRAGEDAQLRPVFDASMKTMAFGP